MYKFVVDLTLSEVTSMYAHFKSAVGWWENILMNTNIDKLNKF